MTKQQKLANEIYEGLLLNTDINTKRIRELLWVVNLTVVDSAIMVIQAGLEQNEDIKTVEEYQYYVS